MKCKNIVKQDTSFKTMLLDLKQITKFGLTISVVFSALIGYLLGIDTVDWKQLCTLVIGGYLMVGSSNTFNQVIERDRDKVMKRTKNRPIPAGRMSVNTGLMIGFLCATLGLYLLYLINVKTFTLGFISMLIYVLAYTPLKTKTPLSVLVGAFPGAIPFALGWAAATDRFDEVGLFLFLFQFLWQFPHFWAIAWLLDEDYKKAGFKLLPTGKKDNIAALQIFLYTLIMIPVSLFPASGLLKGLNLSGVSGILVFSLGLYILYYAIKMIKEKTNAAAKKMMLMAVIYLPLVQLVYIIDKVFNR